MSFLVRTVGAVGFAMLISTGAFAQVPADPANPNEAVPDAMPVTPYGAPIDLATAKKVAAAAVAETVKRNWQGMCIAVVGPTGDLVYFEKQDNCQYASVTISQHKARTAARFRRPTVALENAVQKFGFNYILTLDDAIASRGGIPLIEDGKIIGAVGCSGGTGSQDEAVCTAAAATINKTQ